ncbi:MAG TPA: IS3 family transposase [Flavisolibacter sp.]|nr:IS3 family transposase [Flavisolibacter sp.]
MIKLYVNKGVCTSKLLHWSAVSRSSFYYKRSAGKRGVKPSTHSVNHKGAVLENVVVLHDIEKTLHQEFCCYGYRNMTGELKDLGWIINHKKVYRLMKEHKLLYGGRIRPEPFKRNFIRFRTPGAEKPLQYLSMDIKYVHVHGWRRNVFLLTVMDIYSRKVLIHMLKASIKKGDVLVMLSLLLLDYKAEGMSLRNDNGSQFIAGVVRQCLKEKGVLQEFSHVATPEDNAYIEALHSNLQREVIDRFEFDSIYHAQMMIDRYYQWYNEKRRHGSLKGKTPNAVYNQYFNPNPFEY